jgi:hypothetical protein
MVGEGLGEALSGPEWKPIAAGGVSCDPEKTIGVVDDTWSEAPNPAGRRREPLTEKGKKKKKKRRKGRLPSDGGNSEM